LNIETLTSKAPVIVNADS